LRGKLSITLAMDWLTSEGLGGTSKYKGGAQLGTEQSIMRLRLSGIDQHGQPPILKADMGQIPAKCRELRVGKWLSPLPALNPKCRCVQQPLPKGRQISGAVLILPHQRSGSGGGGHKTQIQRVQNGGI